MSISRLMQKAAAGAGEEPLAVEDAFSTYLYEGNGSEQTITNGIDLENEGGLVWSKIRDDAGDHFLQHKTSHYLSTNTTTAETADNRLVTQFNSDGYDLGIFGGVNGNDDKMVSWTFRKAPRFFDVVTYTGSGENGQTITHNLGVAPGMVIVKGLDTVGSWYVYHRSLGSGQHLKLNTSDAFSTDTNYEIGKTTANDTEFSIDTGSEIDAAGSTYIAYFFAHNDGDGEFGPTGDQDIIKCGSYTGTGNDFDLDIDLGFEPQWVLIKNSSSSSTDWHLFDNMRGMVTGSTDATLWANLSTAEDSFNLIQVTPTGFQVAGTLRVGASGDNYIYIAIRRGPMRPPESGTEVFAVQSQAGGFQVNRFASSGFPVDFVLDKESNDPSNWIAIDRLRGGNADLRTNLTDAEATNSPPPIGFDFNDGITEAFYSSSNTVIIPMFRRAPGFFDVVAYRSESYSASGYEINHNLGVKPELIIIKNRDEEKNWTVYADPIGATQYLELNNADAAEAGNELFKNTEPTESIFTVGNSQNTGTAGFNFIAYLFATLTGVSKVGSYTGNGSSQTIDCEFTSGARFILIKRTDSTGDWYVWDTERGIVSGTEGYLELNTTDVEDTSTDSVDPDSTGFIVNQNSTTDINASGGEYIFLAIA